MGNKLFSNNSHTDVKQYKIRVSCEPLNPVSHLAYIHLGVIHHGCHSKSRTHERILQSQHMPCTAINTIKLINVGWDCNTSGDFKWTLHKNVIILKISLTEL